MTETSPTCPVILVVEDDLMLRLDIIMTLQEEGFSVVEAGNADEAIAILNARSDIRIVFTDIQMPGSMDGITLAAAVRDRWPPIEIVLTSGLHNIGKNDIPERGMFLSKPVRPCELIAAVKRLLGQQS